MNQSELLKSFVLAIISSGALNAIVSHFLYSKKLKSENKYKGNEIISKDIGISLKTFRNLELELTHQELYEAEKEFKTNGAKVNMFEQECIYPEIFNNWNSYYDFFDKIQIFREKYEKYLSCEVALNAVYIDRYIMQLGLFMKTNGDESMLPDWGTLFICDLQKWQMKIDKLLIKEINKHEYKLESHETKKWNRLRKKIIEKEYKKTILYYLLTGDNNMKQSQRQIIDEIVKGIKNDYTSKKSTLKKRKNHFSKRQKNR